MKSIFKIFSIALVLMVFFTACQFEEPGLEDLIEVSQLDFSITQNPNDPNMVILESMTPGVIPLWITPIGRSTKVKDTVRLAFPNTYKFVYNVQSGGGYVSADTVTIDITTTNLSYVDDPLWVALTGGVDNSKTWILDNGKYGLAPGPLSYADPSQKQVWMNYQPNWEPTGSDVGATESDYSAEMTFSLTGGPYLETVKPNEAGNESGTFSLNANNHTLSTTNATIIRLTAFIDNADNWTSDLNILELNQNQLRVSVMRTNEEGPWWYILNFVSKTYAESYEPEFVPDPNFNFGNQLQILAGNSATTWKLDTNTPFNWTDLNGVFLNGWYSISDYADWTGYNAGVIADIENVRITFSKTGDVTIAQNDGTVQEGIFSLEESKNLITFQGIEPSVYISGGWVYATTTDYAEDDAGNVISKYNQWKIVKTASISGVVTEVWFGRRDPSKPEYMVFHFELVSGVPDVEREMIRGLCGSAIGESSRTFKVDLNWPVDWTNPLGEGWTVVGTQDDWYWNEDIAASVRNQTITFSQVDGVVTVSKKDNEGNINTSPVEISGENQMIIIPDINIIQFGAGSWLPTTGPNYKWVRGEFNQVEEEGFWIGVQSNDTEFTAYHYILE